MKHDDLWRIIREVVILLIGAVVKELAERTETGTGKDYGGKINAGKKKGQSP
jgi:hypothetical protein